MPAWSAGRLVRDGKSKQVLEAIDPAGAVDPRKVVMRFKDDATAFDGTKHALVPDKAVVNAAISWKLLGLVAGRTGLRTHLLQRLSERDQLCRKLEIVPVEVVVRNRVAGSAAARFGREEGEPLPEPMVEFFLKSDELHDPPLSDCHAVAFGWAAAWELAFFRHAALLVNGVLTSFWDELGIELVDFKIEFGRSPEGALLLADEISPDGSRLWERGTGRRLDKDVFRRDLGDLSATYRELHRRVFGLEPEAG